MIAGFGVRGFKSLVDFSIEDMGGFTCFVGLNGAGKSSILQFLDFASHLMKGDIPQWLSKRGWSAPVLHSKLSGESNIYLAVGVKTSDGRNFIWAASFNRTTLSCTTERITELPSKNQVFNLARGKYSFAGEQSRVDFTYTGSILSVLKPDIIPTWALEIKNKISSIRSLELLSPHLMRMSLREPASDIGVGGERLSSFLYGIKGPERETLVRLLKKFYPSVVDFKIKQERAGWKKLSIIEEFNGARIETDSRHVNDGLLRILAIVAQSQHCDSLLMFDEVENGVNPEVVELLVEVLQETGRQVLVTTHSPMILNYLTDDVAKKSVRFVYRSFDGGTRSRPLFSVSRIESKLKLMGPGEAFVDTDLTSLAAECAEDDGVSAEKASEEHAPV